MKQGLVPSNLPNDVLWGCASIAHYIGRTRSQTFYLIKKRRIPVKQIGPKTILARKSELDRALAKLEATDAPNP
jgi:hypothetical protein